MSHRGRKCDGVFLIHTDIQKKWIRKFKKIESEFKARAAENDIQSRFPYENIEWLIKEGYTKLTLPVEYGVKVLLLKIW